MDTIATATPHPLRPLRIVIPGGSGQVGQVLARHFTERGHQVTVLTRGPYTAPWQTVHWGGEDTGPWAEYLEGADACINLAGRSVNCRYNAENRQAIYESRIQTHATAGQGDRRARQSATGMDERLRGHDLFSRSRRERSRSAGG